MSKAIHLTDRFIRAAKARSGELQSIIDTGFNSPGQMILRVSPKGLKTFTFRYRNLAGRRKRYRIGHYPSLSLGKAREAARKLSARVANGEDPSEDRLKEKKAAREAMRFEELARLYMRDHSRLHKAPSSVYGDQRTIDKDLLPALGDRDIRMITRADVMKILDGIVARGSKVMANRTRALLSVIFTFARNKGYLPVASVNPCQGVPLPGGKEKSRDRVLNRQEIATLWKALESLEGSTASICRLMLLTGSRSGEVKSMSWKEIDWEEELWIIPGRKMKNRQEHRVPLSRAALECLNKLKEEAKSEEWVFPSRFKNMPHIRILEPGMERLRKSLGSSFDHFTAHDLRRTVATELSKLTGVDDVLIAKILGHRWADRQVTSVYNRWDKLPEMREALERWASKLEQIATGVPAKVVKMRLDPWKLRL